ncbi:acyltransferase family protein [Terrabacter sp. AAH1]|jgi:peptidoglycan/LPS O-acetylase OafA/YrhL
MFPSPPAPVSGRRTPSGGSRLALLDLLRFVAAAAVVLYHFTARSGPAWPERTVEIFPTLHQFTKYGYLGVELFFFVSGFVILMTAWGRDLPGYVASRIARLFPAYWVAVLATGALLISAGSRLKHVGPREVLMNLTMVQAPFGVRDVDGVYWTLWVELRFYVLIGLFLLVGITRNRVIAFAMLWPVVGALARITGSDLVAGLLIADWAPFFAAGMLVFLARQEGWTLTLVGLCGFQLAWAVTLAVDDSAKYAAMSAALSPFVVAAVVFLAFLAVAFATTTSMASFRWPLATALGLLTYPLYLIHEFWGWFVISKLSPQFADELVLGLALLTVVLLAWLIQRLVERPFARPLRKSVESFLRDQPGPGTVRAPKEAAHAREGEGGNDHEDVLLVRTDQ